MPKRICALTVMAFVAWLLMTGSTFAEDYAFVDVTVIPMKGERVLPHQTVVISGGRILELGKASEVKLPSSIVRISGKGRFLIPGFTDAHTHLVSTSEFPLYVANGVTTVFNLHGQPSHLMWRRQVQEGTLFGPTILTSGPTFASRHSPEEAVRMVDEQAAAGYDAVKIYSGVGKEEYPALIAEAKKKHLLLMGHVAHEPGFEATLSAGQSIAHAEEFTYSYFNQGSDDDAFSRIELDESKIPEVVRKTKAAGIVVIPTISTFRDIIRQATELDQYLDNPQMRLLAPWVLQGLMPEGNRYQNRYSSQDIEFLRKSYLFQKKLIVALARGGVPLLAGTDSTMIGPISGFSIHEELAELVNSGLTPMEALQAATVNAAEYFGRSSEFGAVEAGLRADLLLLSANPLTDIANARKIAGVMMRGQWYDPAELRKRVDAIPDAYAKEMELLSNLFRNDVARVDAYLSENDPQGMLGSALLFEEVLRQGVSDIHQKLLGFRKVKQDSFLAGEESVNELGYALWFRGHPEKAIEVFAANAQDFPTSIHALDTLAKASAKSDNIALALESYQKALALDPNYPNAAAAQQFVLDHSGKSHE